MGTNVVRLTDRKYMMELRQRIHEDFNEMLAKRIENREVRMFLLLIFLLLRLDYHYTETNAL